MQELGLRPCMYFFSPAGSDLIKLIVASATLYSPFLPTGSEKSSFSFLPVTLAKVISLFRVSKQVILLAFADPDILAFLHRVSLQPYPPNEKIFA
ncbi:MAG: hypothetical protein IJ744_05025 [Lachnospiraceae bacterium]|nr:hypothetical protein [Lachnospiraceae bacterium]